MQKYMKIFGHHRNIFARNLFKINQRNFFHQTNRLLKKDYYKTLGVSNSASQDEIKKAYFKLAKEWHPDVNKSTNAKERFAEISEAYDTVGDAEKRKSYDNYGITGDEQAQYQDFMKNMGGGKNPFGGFDFGFGGGPGGPGGPGGQGADGKGFQNFWEEVQDFFSDGTNGKRGSSQGDKRIRKGKDVTVNLEVSFMESINGCQKVVTYERVAQCSTCNGTKCKPGSSPSSCSNCGGSGKMFFKQGFMTIQMECSSCNGEGTTIRNPCLTCYGKGYTNTNSKENVTVPKGVDENLNLRVAKKGHFAQNGQAGDLYVKVKVKPHPYFKRDNYDINTTNYINISQAVLGGNIKVKTLYGDVNVYVEPGTNDGDSKKLLNYGITKLPPNQHQKGNHFVKFKVKIPSKMTDKMKKLYEEISKLEEPVDEYPKDV